MNSTLLHFAAAGSLPLSEATVRLHPRDNIVIVKTSLQAGTRLSSARDDLRVQQTIPSGHKLAVAPIAKGDVVRRYGQIIGFAARPIAPGDHVHSHNLSVGDFDRDYAFGADVKPIELVPERDRRTFKGYRRANGQVGTRNYLALISTVNCSAHVTRQIAQHFTPDRLAPYPNVDGVIALTHPYGCSAQVGGADHQQLQRVLAGMALHPNVGAYVLIGLGCEVNQISDLIKHIGSSPSLVADGGGLGWGPPTLTIQDLGGTRKTIEAGIKAVEELLPHVNAIQRTPQPISQLMIGMECGGSDSWSGVTANPLVGLAGDEIVKQGGSIVVSETTEIYGAEHLLTRRAISEAIGRKLIDQVKWWETYTRQIGTEIDNNPSPGNKAGGLTTIYEKALGAIAKGGSTPLTGVYAYAEPITTRGFAFMDSPGNDWTSVTGEVASGCNLVLFTTGRGSVFGFKPAPSIKIATNTPMFERMIEDMDFNAGRLLDGERLPDLVQELLDLTIAVASGEPSKSEALGIGEAEFAPWHLGETL
ncbi:MAG TPA: altronate dehydratase family protein [Anaerolineae bacterium]|nr:altronate dehydratase family protein [Anaerolineae bacterium]